MRTEAITRAVSNARTVMDDPLVSASDLDLEVLAAQLGHKPAPELERQVFAEMQARKWARSAA